MHDAEAYALARQLEWYAAPWVAMADRHPPGPGHYWVTVSRDVHDDGERTYSSRIDHWNGVMWDTAGGYSTVEAWCVMPQPWTPHSPGCLSLDNVLGRHGCDCR
jgi:hypothetical protein